MTKTSPKAKQLHHSVTEIPALAAEEQHRVDNKSVPAPANGLKNLQRRFAK